MTTDESQMRSRSRTAFGQENRLALMLAIDSSPEQRLTLSGLAAVLGVASSSIQKSFGALVELGLLIPEQLEAGQRKRFHSKAESAAWEWARELADSASRSSETNRNGEAIR